MVFQAPSKPFCDSVLFLSQVAQIKSWICLPDDFEGTQQAHFLQTCLALLQ